MHSIKSPTRWKWSGFLFITDNGDAVYMHFEWNTGVTCFYELTILRTHGEHRCTPLNISNRDQTSFMDDFWTVKPHHIFNFTAVTSPEYRVCVRCGIGPVTFLSNFLLIYFLGFLFFLLYPNYFWWNASSINPYFSHVNLFIIFSLSDLDGGKPSDNRQLYFLSFQIQISNH